jgi:cytochrome b561
MKSYSLPQILLHWMVALLVLMQFLNDRAIGAAWRALRRGEAELPPGLLAYAHIVVGVAILALAAWRIALRLGRGAPRPPGDEPRILQVAAAGTHSLLYLMLLLLPLSGLAAWYGGIGAAADLHETLQSLVIWVIAFHFAGALYQQFVRRSDAVARMLRPAR